MKIEGASVSHFAVNLPENMESQNVNHFASKYGIDQVKIIRRYVYWQNNGNDTTKGDFYDIKHLK